MTLRMETPPANVTSIAKSGLRGLTPRSSERFLGGAVPPENLSVAAPHQVFSVSLSDAQAGRLLVAAVLVGWRYLAVTGDSPVAALEVSLNPTAGTAPQFNHINRGPFVDATAEAVRRLGDLEAIPDSVLRLLRIPALYVVALWLHGERFDRLVPLDPAPRGFVPYRSYSESEFIRLVMQLIETRNSSLPAEGGSSKDDRGLDRSGP